MGLNWPRLLRRRRHQRIHQTLTYTVADASKGTVYLADGANCRHWQQTLSMRNPKMTYTRLNNAAGQDSFSVTDSGDGDNSITETVNLDISALTTLNGFPLPPSEDVAYTFSFDLLAGVTDCPTTPRGSAHATLQQRHQPLRW